MTTCPRLLMRKAMKRAAAAVALDASRVNCVNIVTY
jgi:hypothetical protein